MIKLPKLVEKIKKELNRDNIKIMETKENYNGYELLVQIIEDIDHPDYYKINITREN